MIGFVAESDIKKCKEWVLWCLKRGGEFDFENKYPELYLQSIGFFLEMSVHYLRRELFESINDWFGMFIYGIVENEYFGSSEKSYQLMNFSTQFCWYVAYECKEDCFLRLGDY